MPSVEIVSPSSIDVVLAGSPGNYVVSIAQGKAKPCVRRAPDEVWGFVYNDPADKEATPNVNAVQIAADKLTVPPYPVCSFAGCSWSLGGVPGAIVGPDNFLRVWVKFVGDPSYYFGDSTFTGASQAVAPAPSGTPPAVLPPPLAWNFGILSLSELEFPHNLSQLGGLIAFPTQQLALDLASPDYDPIWQLGDPTTGPYWRLSLLHSGIAKIRLRLLIGGGLVQQDWACADFDLTAGGIFEPFGNPDEIFITERLELTLP